MPSDTPALDDVIAALEADNAQLREALQQLRSEHQVFATNVCVAWPWPTKARKLADAALRARTAQPGGCDA